LARSEKSANRTAVGPDEIEGHGDQTIDLRHNVPQYEVLQNQYVSSKQTLVARKIAGVPGIDRGPVDPHQTHSLLTHKVRPRRV
jgi:hypothetical protein